MTNLEHTLRKIKGQELDLISIRDGLCRLAYYDKHGESCENNLSWKCEFYDDRAVVEYLLAEHKE